MQKHEGLAEIVRICSWGDMAVPENVSVMCRYVGLL